MKGRHILIPFPRPEDIATAAEVCQSFILDNGAFTIWKQGGKLDVAGYIEFCRTWHRHPAFDWAIIPDEIEGDEAANDAMLSDWPDDLDGAPVWHMHESIDRLKRLCDSFRVVCLGSSGEWETPGTESWWARMSEAIGSICDSDGRPPCKLHGLRMLSPDIFTRLPLSSADSTNAVRNGCSIGRFGVYAAPNQGTRMDVIAQRIEAHQSAPVWIENNKQVELTF